MQEKQPVLTPMLHALTPGLKPKVGFVVVLVIVVVVVFVVVAAAVIVVVAAAVIVVVATAVVVVVGLTKVHAREADSVAFV